MLLAARNAALKDGRRMGVEMDWCSVCVCCVCMCCGEEAPKVKGNRMRTVQVQLVQALHDDIAWDREPL